MSHNRQEEDNPITIPDSPSPNWNESMDYIIGITRDLWMQSTITTPTGIRFNHDTNKWELRCEFKDANGMHCQKIVPVNEEGRSDIKWVQQQFGKLFRDTVYSYFQNIETNMGFVDIPLNIQQQLTIPIDLRQTTALKYMPKATRKPKDKHKKPQTEYWIGLMDGGKQREFHNGEAEQLFPLEFLQQIKMNNLGKPGHFVPIPVGNARPTIQNRPSFYSDHSAPKVHYQQQNAPTCVFHSFASALHYLGMTEVAEEIHTLTIPLKQYYHQPMKQVIKYLQSSIDRSYQPKSINSIKFPPDMQSNNTHSYFSALFNSKQIVLVTLASSDGAASHAITIIDNWIFDSNEKIALPLTKDALDYCTWDTTNYMHRIPCRIHIRQAKPQHQKQN